MSLRLPVSLLSLIALLGSPALAADEPWLVVRVDRPGRVLEHEVVNRVGDALLESPDYRDRLDTPEMQRVLGGRDLLELTLGVDWRTGVDRLFRQVELRSFDPKQPREAVVVVQSDSRETLAKALAAIADRQPAVASLATEAGGPASDSPAIRKLGEAYVTIDGPRLIVSPIERHVRDAIGRSLDNAKEGDGPVVSARVDLADIRELPRFRRDLVLPAKNPGAVATFGGWMDHLLRGRAASLEIDATEDGLVIVGRLESDPAARDTPRVDGFFAPADAPTPAPLDVPGAVLAASWHADYRQLWEQRRELVVAEAVDRMEKRDVESAKESEVLGLRRRPSEVVGMLGTEYHLVVLRGGELEYDVDREERLPRAAFAVSLRDADEFRSTLDPVFRFLGVIISAQQKMLVTNEEHGTASITTARFRDDEQSVARGNQLRFHLSPSWTITDRHFVVGTTRSAVTETLDAIGRPRTAEPGTTSSSVISLANLAAAVDDAKPLLVDRAQLDQGVTSRRAEAELNVFHEILETLGELRTRTTTDDDTIEVTIEVGGP